MKLINQLILLSIGSMILILATNRFTVESMHRERVRKARNLAQVQVLDYQQKRLRRASKPLIEYVALEVQNYINNF